MVKAIRIFDYEPPKQPRRTSNKVKVLLSKDAVFCFVVKCYGRIVSKHKSFYHAQAAVEQHLRTGKVNNSYEIVHF